MNDKIKEILEKLECNRQWRQKNGLSEEPVLLIMDLLKFYNYLMAKVWKCIEFWKIMYVETPIFFKAIKNDGLFITLKNYRWRFLYYVRDSGDKLLLFIYLCVYILFGEPGLTPVMHFVVYCLVLYTLGCGFYVYKKFGWDAFMEAYGRGWLRFILFVIVFGPHIWNFMHENDIPWPW